MGRELRTCDAGQHTRCEFYNLDIQSAFDRHSSNLQPDIASAGDDQPFAGQKRGAQTLYIIDGTDTMSPL